MKLELSSKINEAREEIRGKAGKLQKNEILEIWADGLSWSLANVRALAEEYSLQFQSYNYDTTDQGFKLRINFTKPCRLERWEYALKANDIVIPPEWKCIDIGCGANPWPRANYITDYYVDKQVYAQDGQQFKSGDVCTRLHFGNKEFDFSTCFHVLEHVSDPVKAAAEISRISKEGIVECPHPFKDGLLVFQESDHRWLVFPSSKPGGPLYFKAIDREWFLRLQDPEAQGAAYRTYITNTHNIGDAAILRNYFARLEPELNIIHHWKDNLRIQVVE